MKYQNYIFDLYGTLVDIHTDESKASVWKKIAVYFSAQGAAYTGKEIKERYGALIDTEAKKLQKKLKKKPPSHKDDEAQVRLPSDDVWYEEEAADRDGNRTEHKYCRRRFLPSVPLLLRQKNTP